MKKNVFRALAAAALIPLMSLGMNGLNVSANVNSSDFNEVESFRFLDSGEDSDSTTGTLPAKVDLRERGVVTPVKFQNPFNDCWAFGALAASETSILSELGKTYDETQLDLSEKHLAWFVNQPLCDEYSSQNGEGAYYHDAVSDSQRYNLGGSYLFATSMFSQGAGPVYESDYPYQGKKGLIFRYINADGELEDLCYSDKDDWSLESSERFQRKYRLEESFMMGPILTNYDETTKKAEYDERILEAVKKQIYQGRGVSINYAADHSEVNEAGNYTYMNGKNWCQYTDTVARAGHCVCVVGYDDNYPKENFNEGHQPPENGAFLVKNSWGSGTNEFPNKGPGNWGIVNDEGVNTGYFWLSYYDMSIVSFEAFDYDVKDHSDETEIIDQYDFAGYSDANTVETKKDCEMANVFTSQYNQKLTDVSCITSTPGTQVSYDVYVLGDDGTSETLAASEKATYEYGGYHMKTLTNPVKLKKGQQYKIVVKLVNPNNKCEVIVPCLDYNNDSSIGQSNNYAKTIVNEGESLLKYNGKWYDWSEIRDTFNENYTEIDTDNFSIKGYSVLLDDTDISNRDAVLSADSYIYDGKAKTPEVTIEGLTYGKDYTVSYYNNVSAGKGRVEIEGTGLFTGKIVKYFSIVDPSAATSAAKNDTAGTLPATYVTKIGKAKKGLTIFWKKKADVTGYQIQYSLKKNMKSAKTLKVKSADTTKRKIRKLKAKRNYYVRIRTYKKVNGTTVYSAWSKIKKAKTK